VRWIIWILLLVSIPVTSFPYFPLPAGIGEALVRPMALYPLAVLLLIDILPALLRREPLPLTVRPLMAFALVSAGTTLVALLDPAPPLRGQVPAIRAARALMTVGIGLGFFLACIRMASTRARLMSSVRWLLVGMGVAVGWGLLQGSRLLFRWPYYAPLNAVQRLISTWDLHETRVTGLTYEPPGSRISLLCWSFQRSWRAY
jgi:hypothetical protein